MKRAAGALGCGAVIAILGGLVGLGGAEFRLPALSRWFKLSLRQAVPLNLLVSLVTVIVAFVTRSLMAGLAPLARWYPEIAALAIGGIAGAWIATALFARVEDHALEATIAVLLMAIAVILLSEAVLPLGANAALFDRPELGLVAGAIVGVAIGMVSSLLGVAGGELIIPALLLLFGADIKTAGTASLAVSLPMVAVGMARYVRAGMFSDRLAICEVAAPMAVGSIFGAALGGALFGLAPDSAIKLLLGVILLVSALKMLRRRHG